MYRSLYHRPQGIAGYKRPINRVTHSHSETYLRL